MPSEASDSDDTDHINDVAAQTGIDVVENDEAWDFFAFAVRSGASLDELRRQFAENARRRLPDQVVGDS